MLRVGIRLDSYISSAWIAKVIKDIQLSGFAKVELAILNNLPEQGGRSFGVKYRKGSRLSRLYEKWDYRRNKSEDDAFEPTDISSLITEVPLIWIHPNSNGSIDIPENQLAEIRNYNLDVLLSFDVGILRSGIGAARYGVWSFQHGNEVENGNNPSLLRELIERKSVSESSLQILTNLNGSQVMYQSYSSTNQVSLYINRNPIYWKTAEFALRCLRNLHWRGIEYIQTLPAYCEAEINRRGKNRTPNNFQMMLFMGRYLSRWLQTKVAPLQSGSRTKWYIGLRRRIAARRFDEPSGYILMQSPKDRFYADPFLIEKDGKTFLFFEDFRYDEDRAVISYCELGPDGTPGPPLEVLRCPYHLSYPFVFEYEGEMYMIPETKENRKVELYRATNFPTAWTAEAVLLDNIHAVDATIQKVNEKFWMFAGVSNGSYSNSDELCLFYADALKGPWTPHRNNPVVSDVRRSRPAGMLFYEKERLIRPSQDCGKAYGYALVFSEVLVLSETEYEERLINRLEPDLIADCIGTHTYNRTEEFEAIDRTLPQE